MFNSELPEPQLLKALLQPLLEDFQYWFERSHKLLTSQDIEFLGAEKQAELLARVEQAQQEVNAAHTMFKATDGQVGVEASVLVPWHCLVTECWQVAARLRSEASIQ